MDKTQWARFEFICLAIELEQCEWGVKFGATHKLKQILGWLSGNIKMARKTLLQGYTEKEVEALEDTAASFGQCLRFISTARPNQKQKLFNLMQDFLDGKLQAFYEDEMPKCVTSDYEDARQFLYSKGLITRSINDQNDWKVDQKADIVIKAMAEYLKMREGVLK